MSSFPLHVFLRVLPPPQTSSAQRQYEKDRFKVQPGSIKDYSLGRGSLANKERLQVGGVRLIVTFNIRIHGGCAIAMKRDISHITYLLSHPPWPTLT